MRTKTEILNEKRTVVLSEAAGLEHSVLAASCDQDEGQPTLQAEEACHWIIKGRGKYHTSFRQASRGREIDRLVHVGLYAS